MSTMNSGLRLFQVLLAALVLLAGTAVQAQQPMAENSQLQEVVLRVDNMT